MLYQVELTDGQLWKRHVDQLLKDTSQCSDSGIVEYDKLLTLTFQLLTHQQRKRKIQFQGVLVE